MLVGQNWKDYFDVVIVQARKPRFFTDDYRPFRVFDTQTGTHLWDRVCKLESSKTYFEGTVKQLQELMNWSGHEVLYFGDHPYSDLAGRVGSTHRICFFQKTQRNPHIILLLNIIAADTCFIEYYMFLTLNFLDSFLVDVTLEHGWRTGAIISELDVSRKP